MSIPNPRSPITSWVLQCPIHQLYQLVDRNHSFHIKHVIYLKNETIDMNCLLFIISDKQYSIPILVNAEQAKEKFGINNFDTESINSMFHRFISIRKSATAVYNSDRLLPYFIVFDYIVSNLKDEFECNTNDISTSPELLPWLDSLHHIALPKDSMPSVCFNVSGVYENFPHFRKLEPIIQRVLAATYPAQRSGNTVTPSANAVLTENTPVTTTSEQHTSRQPVTIANTEKQPLTTNPSPRFRRTPQPPAHSLFTPKPTTNLTFKNTIKTSTEPKSTVNDLKNASTITPKHVNKPSTAASSANVTPTSHINKNIVPTAVSRVNKAQTIPTSVSKPLTATPNMNKAPTIPISVSKPLTATPNMNKAPTVPMSKNMASTTTSSVNKASIIPTSANESNTFAPSVNMSSIVSNSTANESIQPEMTLFDIVLKSRVEAATTAQRKVIKKSVNPVEPGSNDLKDTSDLIDVFDLVKTVSKTKHRNHSAVQKNNPNIIPSSSVPQMKEPAIHQVAPVKMNKTLNFDTLKRNSKHEENLETTNAIKKKTRTTDAVRLANIPVQSVVSPIVINDAQPKDNKDTATTENVFPLKRNASSIAIPVVVKKTKVSQGDPKDDEYLQELIRKVHYIDTSAFDRISALAQLRSYCFLE